MTPASCIYEGVVRHRRFTPVRHDFTFPVSMLLLDLAEVDQLLDQALFWSSKRLALGWFRRQDYLAPHNVTLAEASRLAVAEAGGVKPEGSVQLLTIPRTYGFCFNPVSFYFIGGPPFTWMVAEITNTPWRQRHRYVLPRHGDGRAARWEFPKTFHVSPFMEMDQEYRWTITQPSRTLAIRMQCVPRGEQRPRFDAMLLLHRRELTGRTLDRWLLRYPAMAAQVFAKIHVEALRLWLKGARVFTNPHPARVAPGQGGRA